MRSSVDIQFSVCLIRIIPEPLFPSQGSQARGTRLLSRPDSFVKLFETFNLVPRAFPFLSLGRREKALALGGLLCILIGQ